MGSWWFTPPGTCDYWSLELYEIAGFDPAKGIPTISEFLTHVHPDDRERITKTIDQMMAKGIGADVKYRLAHRKATFRLFIARGGRRTWQGMFQHSVRSPN